MDYDDTLKLFLSDPRATLRALDIVDGQESLLAFTKRLWPVLEPQTPFVNGWAMEAICEHLEAVTDGYIKRLLVNVPPGFSKSMLTDVFFPAWRTELVGAPQLENVVFGGRVTAYHAHEVFRWSIQSCAL